MSDSNDARSSGEDEHNINEIKEGDEVVVKLEGEVVDDPETGGDSHTTEYTSQLAMLGGVGFVIFGFLYISCGIGTCGTSYKSILNILALLSALVGIIGYSINKVFR